MSEPYQPPRVFLNGVEVKGVVSVNLPEFHGGELTQLLAQLETAGYETEVAMVNLRRCFERVKPITVSFTNELKSLQQIMTELDWEPDTRKPLANREDGWYRQFANTKRYQR